MKIAHLIVTMLLVAGSAVAAPTQAQLQKDRVATAEQVYLASMVALKSGRATTETAYVWSTRWLDSQYDRATVAKAKKQALVDHAARMLDLETQAATLRDAGQLTPSDASAATYFRIEADLWVLRGKPH